MSGADFEPRERSERVSVIVERRIRKVLLEPHSDLCERLSLSFGESSLLLEVRDSTKDPIWLTSDATVVSYLDAYKHLVFPRYP